MNAFLMYIYLQFAQGIIERGQGKNAKKCRARASERPAWKRTKER